MLAVLLLEDDALSSEDVLFDKAVLFVEAELVSLVPPPQPVARIAIAKTKGTDRKREVEIMIISS
ncbi:hypothetical protein [Uliginosibacterium gangwonense]|uniref:hypothetical protein n=1 Tax=Uliginosibacterium gangwonense TaxID=392736 RepID=UPI001FDF5965|nr:hypothetical protein [Uliginosibacterium gangwonense]